MESWISQDKGNATSKHKNIIKMAFVYVTVLRFTCFPYVERNRNGNRLITREKSVAFSRFRDPSKLRSRSCGVDHRHSFGNGMCVKFDKK